MFQPCFTPCKKAIFSLFWPLFGPHGAIFGTLWVWQMGQTGQPECHQCCSNLVLNRSTTIFLFLRGKKTFKKAFLDLLWPLLANCWDPRPIFSHVLPEKKRNMVYPYAPCWVLSLFCLFQPKIWPLGQFVWPNGYFHFIWAIFAPFRPYLGDSGSGKWGKLVSLDVLSAVPTSFQQCSIK